MLDSLKHPNYKHTCTSCVFLGDVQRGRKIYDLYLCKCPKRVLLLYRWDDREESFSAIPVTALPLFRNYDDLFYEIHNRAIEAGLL